MWIKYKKIAYINTRTKEQNKGSQEWSQGRARSEPRAWQAEKPGLLVTLTTGPWNEN